jgi:hypothetical protein
MKVYCETPPDLSKAMGRVVAALKREAPRGLSFVSTPEEADLLVLHVIGFPETELAAQWALNHGKRYSLIQYCMRSTQRQNTKDWESIWTRADLVWSYYDLPAMVKLDADGGPGFEFSYYDAPMGVDPIFSRFEPSAVKMFTLMTSGYVAESESVTEAAEAVYRLRGRHFHLGPKNVAPKADVIGLGISDWALGDTYARTCWVSGLRRAEGFEMPAAESACCGAIPIVFDAPHYRRWYEGIAEFIPEKSPAEVTDAIMDVFERGFVFSESRRQDALSRFDWKKIIPGFWEGVL